MTMPAPRALAAALSLGALALLAACTDFEAPEENRGPDVAVAAPSFRNDIQPIFEARCATAGCHSASTRQAELSLADAATSHAQLVERPAEADVPFQRVRTAKPDSSWLVRVLEEDPARRFNFPRMPLGRPPLTANQIGNIVRWIEQGAQNN